MGTGPAARSGGVDLLPWLSLTMVWNQGVTFGLFKADGPWGRCCW